MNEIDSTASIETQAKGCGEGCQRRARRLQLILLTCVGFVVVAHVIATVVRKALGDGWRPVTNLFELDREFNVPALFSASMLLFCGALAGLIARRETVQRLRKGWWVLAVGLVYMAADETFSIHEKFSKPVNAWVDRSPFAGNDFLYHGWLLPYLVFALIAMVAMWHLLKALPWSNRRWFFLAGGVFLAGAMGVELIAGLVLSDSSHEGNVVYAGLVMLEESLEMVGVQILIHALLIRLVGRKARSGEMEGQSGGIG